MELEAGLVAILRERYGMQNPAFVTSIVKGFSTENFVIEDQGTKYFVKTHAAKRERERLEQVFVYEQLLLSGGVPAIVELKMKNGDMLFEHKGRYISVLPFIADLNYETVPSIVAYASSGSTLAKMHLVTKDSLDLLPGRTMDGWDDELFNRQSQRLLRQSSEGNTEYDRMAREFVELKIKLVAEAHKTFTEYNFVPDALLHNDFHTRNLFFNADDQVSGVFDFERASPGARATEVGFAVLYICFDYTSEQILSFDEKNYAGARALLSAYNEVYPITRDEVRTGLEWAYWSKCAYQLWPANVHYLDQNNRADPLLPARLSNSKYFATHRDQIFALADSL